MGDDGNTSLKNDECRECGGLGRLVGESAVGGPSVGAGAPAYVEHWECMTENCNGEWSV